jgi:putative transcriptional regulator
MKSLKGHFLIAAPTLLESNFRQTVVLMLQHDENGALGVIVNRMLEMTIQQACQEVMQSYVEIEGNLFQGGPCEQLLLVLHSDDLLEPGDEPVMPGLHFSTDRDVIEKLVARPPESMKFIVGYSGWTAGQLEGELKTGSWIVVPATAQRAFGPTDGLWNKLLSEANLSQYVNPKFIPEDPSLN